MAIVLESLGSLSSLAGKQWSCDPAHVRIITGSQIRLLLCLFNHFSLVSVIYGVKSIIISENLHHRISVMLKICPNQGKIFFSPKKFQGGGAEDCG